MLNPDKKLNTQVFSKDVEQVPIRKGFGQGLLKAGEQDKNVVALCADLTESTQMHLFKERFPERFVEIGVAEQNLVTGRKWHVCDGKNPILFVLCNVFTWKKLGTDSYDYLLQR
jgi:transketolase